MRSSGGCNVVQNVMPRCLNRISSAGHVEAIVSNAVPSTFMDLWNLSDTRRTLEAHPEVADDSKITPNLATSSWL